MHRHEGPRHDAIAQLSRWQSAAKTRESPKFPRSPAGRTTFRQPKLFGLVGLIDLIGAARERGEATRRKSGGTRQRQHAPTSAVLCCGTETLADPSPAHTRPCPSAHILGLPGHIPHSSPSSFTFRPLGHTSPDVTATELQSLAERKKGLQHRLRHEAATRSRALYLYNYAPLLSQTQSPR